MKPPSSSEPPQQPSTEKRTDKDSTPSTEAQGQQQADAPAATSKSEAEVQKPLDQVQKSGATLQNQLALIQQQILEELQAAAELDVVLSPLFQKMHKQRLALLREAERCISKSIEDLDRKRQDWRNVVAVGAGLLIAAAGLFATILSLSLQKGQADQIRRAAHADEPIKIAILPGKKGDVDIRNLSRFPLKNVEVQWDTLLYSTACDVVVSGGFSYVGFPDDALFPASYLGRNPPNRQTRSQDSRPSGVPRQGKCPEARMRTARGRHRISPYQRTDRPQGLVAYQGTPRRHCHPSV